jgi:hypothetical protein
VNSVAGCQPLRKATFILSAVIGVALLIGAYCLMALVSEQRTYGPMSPDYLLLTPKLIRQLPVGQAEEVAYAYSAADGPKPTVSSIEFVAKEAHRAELESGIRTYLTGLGFVEKSPGQFAQTRHEVAVESTPMGTEKLRIKVVDLDYID